MSNLVFILTVIICKKILNFSKNFFSASLCQLIIISIYYDGFRTSKCNKSVQIKFATIRCYCKHLKSLKEKEEEIEKRRERGGEATCGKSK